MTSHGAVPIRGGAVFAIGHTAPRPMQIFIQTIVTGLVTGCLYALIALGYSMVYGVLKLLNFAHGDLKNGVFYLFHINAKGTYIPVPTKA